MQVRTWQIVAAGLLALTGCGMKQDKFIENVTEADCAYRQACLDDAVLTFSGWQDHDTCVGDVRAEWEDRASGACEYDKPTARDCVKALEEQALACPGTELTLPNVCMNVFLCSDTGTDAGTDTSSDTGSL